MLRYVDFFHVSCRETPCTVSIVVSGAKKMLYLDAQLYKRWRRSVDPSIRRSVRLFVRLCRVFEGKSDDEVVEERERKRKQVPRGYIRCDYFIAT